MPLGLGYSVEAQVTGEEVIGGLQIEVTPSKVAPHLLRLAPAPQYYPSPPPSDVDVSKQSINKFRIFTKDLQGVKYQFVVDNWHTLDRLKSLIQAVTGIPPDQPRLIYASQQLEDGTYAVYRCPFTLLTISLGRYLGDYSINEVCHRH